MRRLLTLAALFAAPALAQTSTPTAKVAEGRLSGTTLPDGQVRRFAGIPFAAPPTGPLRWKEPQPAAHWTGTRSAADFAPRCYQLPLFADMVFRSPSTSEDCLYLNVWSPANTAAKRPVLVYFYGGGFQAGAGDEPRYDGAALARRGIVVVTVNYRLGALGFLASPALTAESPHHASGNYGLLDQAAAIAWVRRNIAAFGGDPARITIGGESAGSMSVSAQMASPLSRASIAGAIGESGAVMGPALKLSDHVQADPAAATLMTRLGVADLAALRAVPADRLAAATEGIRFGPIVDGWFLTEDPTLTFAAGRQARVPLLVGTNSQEGAADFVLGKNAPTLAAYRAGLARQFGPDAAAVEALYPAAGDADVTRLATEIASDRFLAHTTWKWMDLQRRTGAPVYYYRYNRVRPPALAGDNGQRPFGAVHSAEIEYALGNLDTHAGYAWTPEDRQVSATMQGYWANFILTGDPNGPGLPRWEPAGTGPAPAARQSIDVVTASQPFPDQARYTGMERYLTPR